MAAGRRARARRLHRARRRQHDRLGHLPAAGLARRLRADLAGRLDGDLARRAGAGGDLRAAVADRDQDRRALCLHRGGVRRVRRLHHRLGLLDRALDRQRRGGGGARRLRRLPVPRRRRLAVVEPRGGADRDLDADAGQHPRRRRGGRRADRHDGAEAGAAGADRDARLPLDRRRQLHAVQHPRPVRPRRDLGRRGADALGLSRARVGDRAGGRRDRPASAPSRAPRSSAC